MLEATTASKLEAKVVNLDEKDSSELETLSAELTAGKGALTPAKYRELQTMVHEELAEKQAAEQKARRNADPEEYDRKHQGVGQKK